MAKLADNCKSLIFSKIADPVFLCHKWKPRNVAYIEWRKEVKPNKEHNISFPKQGAQVS